MKGKFLLILGIISYCFYSPFVNAYVFVNEQNESLVKEYREDIYLLKNTYDEFFPEEDDVEIVYEDSKNNNDSYWWPIGSEETTVSEEKTFAIGEPEEVTITSNYGYRTDPGTGENSFHSGIDLAPSRGVGVTNVIAAQSGTVVESSLDNGDDCPTTTGETLNSPNSMCGGSYGNYVVIQHSDGNYTLYGHMHAGTLTVKSGDVVRQGQVIGKVGSSGRSTGAHLHFEVRLSENNYSSVIDPLEFVNQDIPRSKASSVSGSAISIAREMINTREGVGCMGKPSIEGDYYIACYGGDGVTTIGHGVTFENNISNFQKRGYNTLVEGDRVPISVIDDIEEEILQRDLGDYILKSLADAGIDDFKEYQIAALISRAYNNGICLISDKICPDDFPDFITAYLKYKGNYDLNEMTNGQAGIWSESMSEYIRSSGEILPGLQKRRVWEWVFFCTGELIDFDSIHPDDYVWY